MTKTVRIENADNNPKKKVIVETRDSKTDAVVSSQELPYPTTLFTYTLHDGNYLRVFEKDIEEQQ